MAEVLEKMMVMSQQAEERIGRMAEAMTQNMATMQQEITRLGQQRALQPEQHDAGGEEVEEDARSTIYQCDGG